MLRRELSATASAVSATTRLCAVLGHPIRHSASPAMHNAAIDHLGLDWKYAAFDVPPEDLGAAIRGAAAMGFIGLNLTVPHKLLAMDLVDALDDSARQWGAVNTVRFERLQAGGVWVPQRALAPDAEGPVRAAGANTDADAIVRAIEEDLGLTVRGASVLLLGAGGAGRTAALRLAREGVRKLYLVNRTRAKAEEAARAVRDRFPDCAVQLGYPEEPVDLALNATSAGLRAEDPLPYDPAAWSPAGARAAFDMIYRPAETAFLAAATAAGCRATNGLGMLLYQGVSAFEIWSGQPAPVEVMRAALRRNIYG
jgi:shikimate dehydrogenase